MWFWLSVRLVATFSIYCSVHHSVHGGLSCTVAYVGMYGQQKRPKPLWSKPSCLIWWYIEPYGFIWLVGRAGFEPTTNWLKVNCSTSWANDPISGAYINRILSAGKCFLNWLSKNPAFTVKNRFSAVFLNDLSWTKLRSDTWLAGYYRTRQPWQGYSTGYSAAKPIVDHRFALDRSHAFSGCFFGT